VSARAWLAAAASLACCGGALGCHHRTHAHDSDAIATSDTARPAVEDSIVGTVSVTGTSFEQRIVLRSGDSVHALALRREDSAAFVQLGGAELVVRGVAAENAFKVHSFTVRAVDGAPVADGVLGRQDGRLVLFTVRGPLTLGNPPAALDSLVHARVWIGGPLTTGPNVYGIIRRAGAPANDRIHLPSEH
jgi:hypothetical protein